MPGTGAGEAEAALGENRVKTAVGARTVKHPGAGDENYCPIKRSLARFKR